MDAELYYVFDPQSRNECDMVCADGKAILADKHIAALCLYLKHVRALRLCLLHYRIFTPFGY